MCSTDAILREEYFQSRTHGYTRSALLDDWKLLRMKYIGWGIWLLYTSEPGTTHIKHQKKRKGVKAPLIEAGKLLQLKDYIHKPEKSQLSPQNSRVSPNDWKGWWLKRFLVYNQHIDSKRNSWFWKFIRVGAGQWTSPKQTEDNKSQETETYKGLDMKPLNKSPGY